ncbi:hypothetical protein ATANTOWER_015994 [Ataeniobius toweri]|uniref:Uncharacterized protein n=1 Tax=Ataeniobius toweri TaxID=208326 RepID=A0ABU7AHP0_9TELE|nr:hypothetical protein [Ataeniobius toweri]
MTDGEGRARFQYEGCQEQGEVQEDVRLSVTEADRTNSPGHNVDPEGQGGGGQEEEQQQEEEKEEEKVEKKRRGSCSGQRERRDEWSTEVKECEEEQEPELEVEAGPTLGVRITAPIRDPDCVSEEEEEQQPYPALSPVAFFCLKQTTRPRNWCLRIVCNPYPFMCWR